MPIITTAQYKTYAGITDTGFDTRLDVLIPAMQDMIEVYCGRLFDLATYTDEVYDGNGEPSLWLKNTPVASVASVKTVSSDGTQTTVDATAYRFRANGELHRFNDNARWGVYGSDSMGFARDKRNVWDDSAPGNVIVTYTGGYSSYPISLQYLMYQLVDAAIDSAGDSWKLASTGDGTESKAMLNPTDFEKRFGDMCRPWKRVLA